MKTAATSTTALGHLLALFTVFVWGITFVSTKVLLADFAPYEVLLSRFVIALVALIAIRPRITKVRSRADEALFAAAGFSGVAAYFLLENIALTMGSASTISVVVSVAPLFIALVAALLGRERLRLSFGIGFLLAMVGIVLITFTGTESASIGWGELMALGAAVVWGVYANLVAILHDRGYETIAMTKRIFAWGILFMLVLLPFFGFSLDFSRYLAPANLLNMLFLGLVASGCCYVTWGMATQRLGASMAGAYIYLSPAVTIVTAILFIDETLTLRIALGLCLVLLGLLVSEGKLSGLARRLRSR